MAPTVRLSALACILLTTYVSSHSQHHGSCIHDELMDNIGQVLPHEERHLHTSAEQAYDFTVSEHGRALQSTYSSMRIKVDASRLFTGADGAFACYNIGDQYQPTLAVKSTDRAVCGSADIITEEKRAYLADVLIPAAVNFFSQSLSVRPVVGNLKLPNPMPDYSCFNDGVYFYNLICCDKNFPQSLRTTGIADADYLLIVTARPTAGSVLAWATECQSDQYARPLCGHANISPARMSLLSKDLVNQIGVVTHEIGHALGFSGSKYSSFRKPGTLNRVDSLSDVLATYSDSTLGKVVKKIVTPKVVEFVKSHYNCPTWTNAGGEIEDYGGTGTAGSHWEKRLVMNELMNPVSEPTMFKSGLTLSYFEDSGWYSVDYSAADKLPWGSNQGCDFVQKKCGDGWSPFYFCRTMNQGGCTADMRYQAQCNLDNNPYITYPANFQYFPGEPGKGGKSPHTDYCPYYQLYSTRDCSDPTTIAYFFYGERPGSGSRCFMGSYQLKTVTSDPAMHGGCLQTTCNPLTNLIQVTLTGSPALDVACPKDGGEIDLSTLANSNYVGTILCPPSKQLCTGDPCDIQDCNGHGKCNNADGSCTCDSGYSGPDGYSCPWKTCPTRINGTICSGHGSCNKLTGTCEDGAGRPGCYAGWSEADCGRQGCPLVNSVECAGSGTCTNGVCVCNTGFIGSDCSLTDCPGLPNRCSDVLQDGTHGGICDTASGLCSCLDALDSNANPFYYYSADCSLNASGTRPFTELGFVGEMDPLTNLTYTQLSGTLALKEYSYFKFTVPTTTFPITLTLRAATGATLSSLPVMKASYATSGRPTSNSFDFDTTTSDLSTKTVTIKFSSGTSSGSGGGGGGGGTSAFSKTGVILVAVVLQASAGVTTLPFTIELARDGCATLVCDFGYCSNGRCVCDRKVETSGAFGSYGWSGTYCEEPDCPGTPDCGGKRGTCVVPPTARLSNGTAVRNNYPSCECQGVFQGQDCSAYSSQADRIMGATTTYVLDGTWNTRIFTNANNNEYWLHRDKDGESTLNGTYTGFLDIGASRIRVLLDPDSLATVGWGLNGSMGVYMRLDFPLTPQADAMLLTQTMVPPTLTDYRDFDIRSWRAAQTSQEISTTVSLLTFINVVNGLYGKQQLSYSLYIEVSTGCPPSLRGCSGHGTCQFACECDEGWEGLRCDSNVPQMNVNTVYETSELLPGDWNYFVYKPADGVSPTAEVTLQLTRISASSASWPLLVAAWDSGRYVSSLGKITSETVFMDYDSVIAHNGTQQVVIRRTNTLSQKWLYIGVRNMPTARSSFIGNIAVADSPVITMELCNSTDPDVCRAVACNDRGTYTVVRGTPSCECDYGWNKDTACSSPIFASFSNLLTAAQNVGFLCSVCTDTAPFARDEMAFFKIPQPLQKGTGLSLSVSPVVGFIPADGTSTRRRQLQGSPPSSSSSSSSVNGTYGVTGHPSLLVSASLPRSILDFVYIQSGRIANQTITITEASATGSYWAAVYANTPGTFYLSAKRAKIQMPVATAVDNVALLLEWLTSSLAGHVVLGVGGFLFALVALSCLSQCCCGRIQQLSKVRETMDQMEEDHAKQAEKLERSLIRMASMDPSKLAQTPALAKALAKNKSMRKMAAEAAGLSFLSVPNPHSMPSAPGKPVYQVAAAVPVAAVPVVVAPPVVVFPSRGQQQMLPASGTATTTTTTSVVRTSLLMQQQQGGGGGGGISTGADLQAALAAAAAGGGGGGGGGGGRRPGAPVFVISSSYGNTAQQNQDIHFNGSNPMH